MSLTILRLSPNAIRHGRRKSAGLCRGLSPRFTPDPKDALADIGTC